MGPTATISQYLSSARYDDLPDSVIHEAKRSFLNWLGVAIGASRHETVEIALRVVGKIGGSPAASILGRADKTDICRAAFLNGTSSHIFDFDDTHLATIIHPTGPVAAAILALAETEGRSGREFLLALILGMEVECRIGNAVYPAHYDIGWHITGTAGIFGAATAASNLLGSDTKAIAQSIGLAATQASGLREMFGTMSKPFHVGRAAENGLLAALLAKEGFTSSETAIEAPRGFANVLSTAHDYDELTSGLGDRFEILKNTYKPYACGIVIHPSIDGCIQLRDRFALVPEEIEAVELQVNPYVLELTGKKEPRSGLEGKFSIFHSAAVALIDGAARVDQYTDERVADPRVIDLRRKVTAVPDKAIKEDAAQIAITLQSGERHHLKVAHAHGSLARPMSDEDLEEKFRSLVEPILSEEKVQRAIDVCWKLDSLPNMTSVIQESTVSRDS